MKEHRFERDGIVSIAYNGDCMEGMKMFEDKRFDLACVDPPYGIDINKSNRLVKEKGRTKKDWDCKIPNSDYFSKLFDISKNQIIWGGNYFPLPQNKCFVIWDKQQPESISFAMCEYAWASFHSGAKIFRYSVQKHTQDELKIHETQKPVALYKWIFKNYAKEGDLILDTHLGSQSSRIAAYEAGLNFIGFELDEDYFKQGCERFDWYVKQLKLF